jgi:MYXO-CTERM domain-containing protein
VIALLLLASSAHAFELADKFDAPADGGGGGGRRFTGSLADGLTCAVCHTGPAANVEIEGLIAEYDPLSENTITIRWPESLVDTAYAAEIVGNDGRAIGTLHAPGELTAMDDERCRVDPMTMRRDVAAREYARDTEGRLVVASNECGARAARLVWTAPESGTAWFHLAVVFSNGSNLPDADPVAAIAAPIVRRGDPPPERAVIDGGCSAGGTTSGLASLVLLFALTARIRRRHPLA